MDWPSLECLPGDHGGDDDDLIKTGGDGAGMVKTTLVSYLYIASIVIIIMCCVVIAVMVWIESIDLTLRQAIVTGLVVIIILALLLPLFI